MQEIHKISAITIVNNEIFMVRKVGKRTWTTLGGKPENNETEIEALCREVKEEINCTAKIIRKLEDFITEAYHDKGHTVKLSTYLVELEGNPQIIDPELEEVGFISKDFKQRGITLPPSMTELVIPFLQKEGLITW